MKREPSAVKNRGVLVHWGSMTAYSMYAGREEMQFAVTARRQVNEGQYQVRFIIKMAPNWGILATEQPLAMRTFAPKIEFADSRFVSPVTGILERGRRQWRSDGFNYLIPHTTDNRVSLIQSVVCGRELDSLVGTLEISASNDSNMVYKTRKGFLIELFNQYN